MDPVPDPTPFLRDFKGCKKIKFFHIFSYNLPAGALSFFSPKNIFFCKTVVLKFYFASIISACSTPL
jgi:hypothetical protein